MTERSCFGFQYIEAPTHDVEGIGHREEYCLIQGETQKFGRVPNAANTDMKANTFQRGRARSEATTNLNERTCIKIVSPFT
jgi:hypothetical protein